MKPIKLALKNITKLNKFIFIFVNLCPWILGSTNGGKVSVNSVTETSLLVKKDDKPDDEEAYNAFLKVAEAQKEADGLHLFFFKVGHGNFILVRDKHSAIVVDAGGNKTADITAYIEELFKTCLGNATLRQIIITHNHEDHTNYVKDVKEWAKGELSSVQNPFHLSSRVISKQYELKLVQIKTIKGFEGISSIFDMFPIHNTGLSFLHPLTKITTKNKNDKSSVFVLTYQGIKVLFTGDATGLSLDNYVEKHQEGDNAIVDANRELLKNIHLFVMPHHGSSTEDSFRWTLYVTKHSPNLLASVICGDPFVDKYKDVRNWVRDISWPDSMRNRDINNLIYYWSARSEVHKKQTNTALFITGAEPCRCVYFKIQGGNLYKYDSTNKNFVHLVRRDVGLNDLYEDNDKVVKTEHVTGEIQMSNIPMNGGGFDRENSKKDSFNPGLSFTPIKKKEEKEQRVFTSRENQYVFDNRIEMVEQKEIQENGPNGNAISKDDDEENGMKEEKDMSSAFPSNVYKFQDAFDDNNDYMAYAS
ncbi:MAG: ComEC/Rec2 family competence protein [Opitutales bacterium]